MAGPQLLVLELRAFTKEIPSPNEEPASAGRIDTSSGPLLVGFDVNGNGLWDLPWDQISPAEPPGSADAAWTVRIESETEPGPTTRTRGPV